MNRKNQLCCWVTCALALLACSGPVSASPVGLTIEGTVSGTLVLSPGPVYPPGPPYTLFPVPPGTPLSATLTWDSAARDFCSQPDSGQYLLAGTVTLLGRSYTSTGGIESNSPLLSCIGFPVAEVLFRLVGFQPIPSSTPPNPSPILPPAGFWLGFDIPAISAHTPPGALPVFFPSAHPYLGFLYSGCFGGCQPQEELHGFFEASPTVIPEPGTIGLFATGLLAGWLRLRHSRPTVRKRL